MTLEEMRLRVMAAFPGETVTESPSVVDGGVFFNLGKHGDVAWCLCGECLSAGRPFTANEDEVERRLLAVSAHDMIATRRRLMETAP